MKDPILIILKPEVFDIDLRKDNGGIFFSNIEFPTPESFLRELFEGIISEYIGPFPITWTEEQIREQYNQPHHFLFEPGFLKNRVDTLVDIYSGKNMQMYIAIRDNDSPRLLTERKKAIRRKFLKNPDVAFYSIYHVSDSLEDAKREIAIYKNSIQ